MPLLESSPLGSSLGNVPVFWLYLPLGSPLEPGELCLVVTDNNFKRKNPRYFSSPSYLQIHIATILQ